MSDYRVYVMRSPKKLSQRFWVKIVAANGETLLHSENYRDKDHALELGQRLAEALNGNLINST